MSVCWGCFSWEAFATIFTGLAAVGGAIFVGVKQTSILNRQMLLQEQQAREATQLAERDIDLRKASFRLDLLARRSDTLNRFREIWTVWSQTGTLDAEEQNSLRQVLHATQLLYSKEIVADIEVVLHSVFHEGHFERRARHYADRGNDAEAQNNWEKAFGANDQVMGAMEALLAKMILETRVLFDQTNQQP